MQVLAFNGSPRKHGNTATLLEHALRGAAARGAETVLHHLGDTSCQGCRSCLKCKKKSLPQTGLCALQDDMSPLLEAARNADVLILGAPVYFYVESALFRAFFERLLFPLTRYNAEQRSLYPGVMPTALIYTMNMSEQETKSRPAPFPQPFVFDIARKSRYFMARVFGRCEFMLCLDTMQIANYEDYHMEIYDADAKARRHADIFPVDCRRAFLLGQQLADEAAGRHGRRT